MISEAQIVTRTMNERRSDIPEWALKGEYRIPKGSESHALSEENKGLPGGRERRIHLPRFREARS